MDESELYPRQDFSAGRFEIALGIGRAFNPMGYSIPDNKGLAPVFTNTSVMKASGGAYPKQQGTDLASWYVGFYDCRTVKVNRGSVEELWVCYR